MTIVSHNGCIILRTYIIHNPGEYKRELLYVTYNNTRRYVNTYQYIYIWGV